MCKVTILLVCFLYIFQCNNAELPREEVVILVKKWATELGKELYNLSMTMTRKKIIVEKFKPLKNKIRYDNGTKILNAISSRINKLMATKTKAVKRIAEYAEYLAYHRKTDELNETFNFYNADNITNVSSSYDVGQKLNREIEYSECIWWCEQRNLNTAQLLPDNSYSDNTNLKALFANVNIDKCNNCAHSSSERINRPIEHYNSLPLKEDARFQDTKVNLNISVVKVNVNIYHRDQQVLQGVRWSEALDLVFKQNLREDPTLKYQYFASPLGYMRHFPGVQWSDERYAQTYDPRTRSWYTEAMTSPKEILILLDRSGSVFKKKRKIAAHIVNNILDTLNDNDFVNIYLFANYTEPLVSCFTDTLVQANEENLRLLRETLDNYDPQYQANISLGLAEGFRILKDLRDRKEDGENCNQAIMLITEAAFMEDSKAFFEDQNWRYGTPVRIFTYQLGIDDSDARLLEWIACSNKGYFVNITLMEEVREKVLQYLNVMSRPINSFYKHPIQHRQDPIWSYLYIDLADRRYTNWLWRKLEGNRQRAIFLDHAKREFIHLDKSLTSESHFLLKENHDYEKYEKPIDFDYMTTLSLPVYGRREEDVELIGVAGIDVPIKLIYSLIPHHKIGVNGYPFIITNNGYILMHAAHVRSFENIPKPTFNRVDLLEVEILEVSNESRIFEESIVKLREQMVQHKFNNSLSSQVFKVKFAVDDQKRMLLIDRKYYYMSLGHFTLGIALPDDYGLMVVSVDNNYNFKNDLFRPNDLNWTAHPDWLYCEGPVGSTKEKIQFCLKNRIVNSLLKALLFDADATDWFPNDIPGQEKFVQKYHVGQVFIGTHSGLTRWKIFKQMEKYVDDVDVIGKKLEFPKDSTIDEDWYKRTVEENFNNDENKFIYSVPFEISGYENDTMITSTNTIFVNATVGNRIRQSPVAVVGLQFNHKKMLHFYQKIAPECGLYIKCYVLDNNAYVVLSDQTEYTGRFIGDIISPYITDRLVANGVYIRRRMFDYQAICQKPPEAKSKNSASKMVTMLRTFLENLLQVTNWALATILMLVTSVAAGPDYESNKNETKLYEKLEINKTVPTPCDQQFWLYTLADNFLNVGLPNKTTDENCNWYYIVQRIPNSNLLFLAVNSPKCDNEVKVFSTTAHTKSPTPIEIEYDGTPLACYIHFQNKFERRNYMECRNNCSEELYLNSNNRSFCGHFWK